MIITDEILINNLDFTYNHCEFPDLYNKSNFCKIGVSSKGRIIPFSLGKCPNGGYTLLMYNDIHEEIIEVEHLQKLFKLLTGSDLIYHTKIPT